MTYPAGWAQTNNKPRALQQSSLHMFQVCATYFGGAYTCPECWSTQKVGKDTAAVQNTNDMIDLDKRPRQRAHQRAACTHPPTAMKALLLTDGVCNIEEDHRSQDRLLGPASGSAWSPISLPTMLAFGTNGVHRAKFVVRTVHSKLFRTRSGVTRNIHTRQAAGYCILCNSMLTPSRQSPCCSKAAGYTS